MNGISTKLGSGALATAIVGIIVWVLSYFFNVSIPADVAVYGSAIVGFIVGFWVPETATKADDSDDAPAVQPAPTEPPVGV